LVALLTSRGEITDVAAATGLDEGLEAVRQSAPDVVLVDLPVSDGHRFVHLINQVARSTVVVAFGVREETSDVVDWAIGGASGCLTQDASVAELIATISDVSNGKTHCSLSAAGLLFRNARSAPVLHPSNSSAKTLTLTRRQQEVARLLADGLSNKEIATTLSIEVATVKNHVHQIFEKLGIHTRAEVANRLTLERVGE
jgi:DNA-binding NarL/FixJ family response regulator